LNTNDIRVQLPKDYFIPTLSVRDFPQQSFVPHGNKRCITFSIISVFFRENFRLWHASSLGTRDYLAGQGNRPRLSHSLWHRQAEQRLSQGLQRAWTGLDFLGLSAPHAGKAKQTLQECLAKSATRGNETILLVEDDLSIPEIAAVVLKGFGYSVLAANTPDKAIRLAEKHAGKIHLLVTDVIMLKMNGRDLAKNLLSVYPHLKRLFMSGFAADVIA
jgi:hypothetical protein